MEFIISKVASIYSKTLLKSDVIQRFWNGQLKELNWSECPSAILPYSVNFSEISEITCYIIQSMTCNEFSTCRKTNIWNEFKWIWGKQKLKTRELMETGHLQQLINHQGISHRYF